MSINQCANTWATTSLLLYCTELYENVASNIYNSSISVASSIPVAESHIYYYCYNIISTTIQSTIAVSKITLNKPISLLVLTYKYALYTYSIQQQNYQSDVSAGANQKSLKIWREFRRIQENSGKRFGNSAQLSIGTRYSLKWQKVLSEMTHKAFWRNLKNFRKQHKLHIYLRKWLKILSEMTQKMHWSELQYTLFKTIVFRFRKYFVFFWERY